LLDTLLDELVDSGNEVGEVCSAEGTGFVFFENFSGAFFAEKVLARGDHGFDDELEADGAFVVSGAAFDGFAVDIFERLVLSFHG